MYRRSYLSKSFVGGAFALDPNLTVFKDFFLPNRHGAFQFADGPFTGFEGRAAVRRADRDHDAGLANLQTTSAMHDSQVRNLELLVRLLTQTPHLAERHWRVGFVNQIKRAPPARPFARIAVERHGRATLG